MRTEFQKIDGERLEFSGEFVRFGQKKSFKGWPETTILLQNVRCVKNSKIGCDHLWFNLTKEFDKIGLQEGDIIGFYARVKPYIKGYAGYRDDLAFEKPVEKDYKLSHPTKIKLIKRLENCESLKKHCQL